MLTSLVEIPISERDSDAHLEILISASCLNPSRVLTDKPAVSKYKITAMRPQCGVYLAHERD